MTPEKATVAVIGSGGREHALVKAYAKSPHVGKILVFPGNDYMEVDSRIPIISYQTLTTKSVPEIVAECIRNNVTLVDVAQDDAVEAGLANATREAGITTVGPSREAGRIEWDKNWSRELMERAGVLQPAFQIFSSVGKGKTYVSSLPDDTKVFVKAAGLALGKGAIPAQDKQMALTAIDEVQKFGNEYLVEEWIEGDNGGPGEEFSAFAYCDGKTWQLVGYAQDHKRALDGDNGPNTGGMGCVSNPLVIDENIDTQTRKNFDKIFSQLAKEDKPYQGVLYFGGMVVKKNGQPTVYAVECNARWGDPEAEVIVPSITNDFFKLNMAVAHGRLNEVTIQTDKLTRISVAAATEGYPGPVVKGTEILGLEQINDKDITIFGAGIRRGINNSWVTNGGRLFHLVATGRDILDARAKAYGALEKISFQGYYRRDIGWRDVERSSPME